MKEMNEQKVEMYTGNGVAYRGIVDCLDNGWFVRHLSVAVSPSIEDTYTVYMVIFERYNEKYA